MDAKILFIKTLTISIVVQIITGLIEIFSLFIKVPSDFLLIRQLLVMEVLVQVIEGMFYIWLAVNLNNITDITPKRYVDWSITTPTMLITLIFYLIYLYHREKGTTEKLDIFTLFAENSNSLFIILMLNWLMLIFGYLGERKILSTVTGVGLGFMPFLIYYYLIYIKYVTDNTEGFSIFIYFFFFWSLYGIAALLPYYVKNSFYNILDLFAKNFFGIFLSYIILFKKY